MNKQELRDKIERIFTTHGSTSLGEKYIVIQAVADNPDYGEISLDDFIGLLLNKET